MPQKTVNPECFQVSSILTMSLVIYSFRGMGISPIRPVSYE
ncbi:MAG: hypothetical protein NTV89_19150 [Proteobacteria bacterium]|nr:hypothetical protein [Pseudomonadota bacterium]